MEPKEIIDKFELVEYDGNEEEVISFKKFIDLINSKSIIDYDGWGYLLYKGQLVNNADISVDNQIICLDGDYFRLLISIEKIDELIGDDLSVEWVNK